MDIGKRIKFLRKDVFKESRESFAEKLGVAAITIGRWERGERIPDANDLGQLLEIFPGTDPGWLLSGEGEMKQRKGPTIITKEVKDGPYGGVREITYTIDELFGIRLASKLVGSRTVEWLSAQSHIDKQRIEDFIYISLTPTVDEVESMAVALGVAPVWLAEKSPIVTENLSHELKYKDNNESYPAELYKSYLIAVEKFLEEIHELIKLTPEKKADVINALCRAHMKQSPASKEADQEMVETIIRIASH